MSTAVDVISGVDERVSPVSLAAVQSMEVVMMDANTEQAEVRLSSSRSSPIRQRSSGEQPAVVPEFTQEDDRQRDTGRAEQEDTPGAVRPIEDDEHDEQVQHNVLVAEQMVKSQIFACVYCAPIVLAIAVVLSSEWHNTCDSFLHLWLFGVGALQVLRLPMRIYLVRRLGRYINTEAEDDQWQSVLEDIRRSNPHMALSFLNVLSLAWYLLGIVETMRTSSDCETESPDTYKLALALVIIFLVFLGFSCMCRLLYICLICFHHILLPPLPNHHQNVFMRNAGVSEEVLHALPRFAFEGETQMPDRDPTCAICLDEFKPSDEVSTLPCGHHFHYSEISQWLRDKRTCPLCNQEVTMKALLEKQAGTTDDSTV